MDSWAISEIINKNGSLTAQCFILQTDALQCTLSMG